MEFRKQRLTPEQAFQKAKHYCAYQERGHQEVKEKLYSFGLRKNEVEELLSRLIEENYLNEQRFAVQFAGGRFRMKQWGRVKIRYELKQKLVGDYNIKKALASIDEADYEKTLARLAESKWESLMGRTGEALSADEDGDESGEDEERDAEGSAGPGARKRVGRFPGRGVSRGSSGAGSRRSGLSGTGSRGKGSSGAGSSTEMYLRRRKLQEYLIQKGYENDMVAEIVKGFGI